jgi:hypothetical protein
VDAVPPIPLQAKRLSEFQEQVDAFRVAEPEPGPDPESLRRQQEEEERQQREHALFLQRYEDEREILLGAYAREQRGIPRLEHDRAEGLGSFVNRLLPAFAQDSDDDDDDERESAGAVSEE